MDIVEEFVTCEVCFEVYDGSLHCPRVFACGHTFCSSCIRLLMAANSKCPTCKMAIEKESLESISVNYSLRQMALIFTCRHFNDSSENTTWKEKNNNNFQHHKKHKLQHREGTQHHHRDGTMQYHEDILQHHEDETQRYHEEDILPHHEHETMQYQEDSTMQYHHQGVPMLYEGYCEKHKINQNFRCMRCCLFVCGNCAIINHKYCRILLVQEFIDRLRKEKILEIHKNIKLALKSEGDILFLLEQYRGLLDERTELECYQKKKQRIKSNCQINLKIKSVLNMKRILFSLKEKLKYHMEVINSASCVKDLNLVDKQLTESLNDLQEIIERTKSTKSYLLQQEIYFIISNRTNLLSAIASDKTLVITTTENELTKWGNLDIQRGHLRIHCVQKGQLPPLSLCLTIEQCLHAMNGSSEWPRKVFFQFGSNGILWGEVIIHLNEAAKEASKTVLQTCLFGHKGFTFKGMEMDWNEEPFIYPICYLPVPPDVDSQAFLKEKRMQKEWKEGDVVVNTWDRDDGMQFRFCIWVEERSLKCELIPAGEVEKGLDVCKDVLQRIVRNEKVEIIDSGWIFEINEL